MAIRAPDGANKTVHKDNRARILNVKLMKLLVASQCWNISHLLWVSFLTRHQQELLDLPNISSPKRKGSVSQAIDLMYTGYGAAATWPKNHFLTSQIFAAKMAIWVRKCSFGINVYWLHCKHLWKHLSSNYGTRISKESPISCGNKKKTLPIIACIKDKQQLKTCPKLSTP